MTSYREEQVGENVSGLQVLLAPIMGLIYVITLPFIAIGAVAVLAGSKIAEGVVNLASRVIHFEWRPTEAYLAGKKRKDKRSRKKK